MPKKNLLLLFFNYIFIGSLISGGTSSPVKNNCEVCRDLLQLVPNSTMHDAPTNNKSWVDDHDGVQMQLTIALNTDNKGLGDKCLLNKDCHSVFYSQCSNGTCSCKDNYISVEGRCKGLITKPCEEDSDCGVGGSTCTDQICSCKTDSYSSANNRRCFPFAEGLHKLCYDDQGCKISFSECSNGTCSCRNNYVEHDGVCYGLPGAQCHRPKNCVFVSYSCKLGTCQKATYDQDNQELSSKPGVTSYWETLGLNGEEISGSVQIGENLQGEKLYLFRPRDSGNWILKGPLEWRSSNYTLDKTIVFRDPKDGKLGLICRLRHNKALLLGHMKLPLDYKCYPLEYYDVLESEDFDVLVEM